MKNWEKWAANNHYHGELTRKKVLRNKKRVAQIRRGIERWNQAVWSRSRARCHPGFKDAWKEFYGK